METVNFEKEEDTGKKDEDKTGTVERGQDDVDDEKIFLFR